MSDKKTAKTDKFSNFDDRTHSRVGIGEFYRKSNDDPEAWAFMWVEPSSYWGTSVFKNKEINDTTLFAPLPA
jgi:hypothetical protein